MLTFFVVATIVLLLTSCIATRYLVGLPLRWPGANFSEWSEELFWLIMWPIPLFIHIRDHHKSTTPPAAETDDPADLESAETDNPADEDAEVSADGDEVDGGNPDEDKA